MHDVPCSAAPRRTALLPRSKMPWDIVLLLRYLLLAYLYLTYLLTYTIYDIPTYLTWIDTVMFHPLLLAAGIHVNLLISLWRCEVCIKRIEVGRPTTLLQSLPYRFTLYRLSGVRIGLFVSCVYLVLSFLEGSVLLGNPSTPTWLQSLWTWRKEWKDAWKQVWWLKWRIRMKIPS